MSSGACDDDPSGVSVPARAELMLLRSQAPAGARVCLRWTELARLPAAPSPDVVGGVAASAARTFDRQINLDTLSVVDSMDTVSRGGHQRGVHAGGWTVASLTGPVLRTTEQETCERALELHTLPELSTLHNTVLLAHRASGLLLAFSGYDALDLVTRDRARVVQPDLRRTGESLLVGRPPGTGTVGSPRRVKAVRHQALGSGLVASPPRQAPLPRAVPAQSEIPKYDWTFSTPYLFTLIPGGAQAACLPQVVSPSPERIDTDRLLLRETIVYFSDTILFEDECLDCGVSQLRVRVRVMPSYWFVLAQMLARLDRTMIWVVETRVFHEFGADRLVVQSDRRTSTFHELRARPHLVRQLHTQPEQVLNQVPLIARVHWHVQLPGALGTGADPMAAPLGDSSASTPAVRAVRDWVPHAPAATSSAGRSDAHGPPRLLVALSPHPTCPPPGAGPAQALAPEVPDPGGGPPG